ncbi:tRNA (guanine(37)-N(1))-methyltransferase-like [Glandiceps talaboti]
MFSPPTYTVSGMKTLDREAFKRIVKVPALKVDKRTLSKLMKSKAGLPDYVLKRKRCRIKNIRDVPNDDTQTSKLILLDPEKVQDIDSLGEDGRRYLSENGIEEKLYDFDLEVNYKDWAADEILRAVLPPDIEVISSFSRMGHIAHMNLRPEQMAYKQVIGQVILDKNPGIKMVVNKVNTIDNEFRFFQMEMMAGEEKSMVVTMKENRCTFEFDFSKVYWNPRLSTEHDRIVGELKEGDVVYDVFAGVGPFAIPAAKKGCKVLANDLNPESYKWLVKNAKVNKVQDRVKCYNLDGRDFIKKVLKEETLKEKLKPDTLVEGNSVHVIMNLPALALEFLDSFKGLYTDLSDEVKGNITIPTVHCHCFSKSEEPARDVQEKAEEILGSCLTDVQIHNVRDVAPNKEMMCVTFQVPKEVLFGHEQRKELEDGEPPAKRSHIEECS